MSKSLRKEKGFRHDAGEPSKTKSSEHDAGEPLKRKRIRTRCRRASEKKKDLGMMLESHLTDRGSRHDAKEPLKTKGFDHDVGEPPKRKRIRTRCWRSTEMVGDPDTMPESRRKKRRS